MPRRMPYVPIDHDPNAVLGHLDLQGDMFTPGRMHRLNRIGPRAISPVGDLYVGMNKPPLQQFHGTRAQRGYAPPRRQKDTGRRGTT
jgi:hypothetical protein